MYCMYNYCYVNINYAELHDLQLGIVYEQLEQNDYPDYDG